jgi:hypothetical protein
MVCQGIQGSDVVACVVALGFGYPLGKCSLDFTCCVVLPFFDALAYQGRKLLITAAEFAFAGGVPCFHVVYNACRNLLRTSLRRLLQSHICTDLLAALPWKLREFCPFFVGYKGGKIYWLAIHSNQANLIVGGLRHRRHQQFCPFHMLVVVWQL